MQLGCLQCSFNKIKKKNVFLNYAPRVKVRKVLKQTTLYYCHNHSNYGTAVADLSPIIRFLFQTRITASQLYAESVVVCSHVCLDSYYIHYVVKTVRN